MVGRESEELQTKQIYSNVIPISVLIKSSPKIYINEIVWIGRRKTMPKRKCDACGKEKDVKNGKTCENGHFICAGCIYGGIFDSTRTSCPLCGKPLR